MLVNANKNYKHQRNAENTYTYTYIKMRKISALKAEEKSERTWKSNFLPQRHMQNGAAALTITPARSSTLIKKVFI